MIKIYTDGACSGNPGPGGWGYVIIRDGDITSSFGSELSTTNNRMELMAAVGGLKALKQRSKVQLWTDSQYVKKGITEWIFNWQIKKKDLIKSAFS